MGPDCGKRESKTIWIYGAMYQDVWMIIIVIQLIVTAICLMHEGLGVLLQCNRTLVIQFLYLPFSAFLGMYWVDQQVFGFSCKVLWKNPNKLVGQPNSFLAHGCRRAAVHPGITVIVHSGRRLKYETRRGSSHTRKAPISPSRISLVQTVSFGQAQGHRGKKWIKHLEVGGSY